jgi:PhoPQ-activated pathogenicity-related protein
MNPGKTSVLLLSALICIWISCSSAEPETEPIENALKSYLENGDSSFTWEVKDSGNDSGLAIYDLVLTSQLWRGFTWKHQLTILVPEELEYSQALLFISGGRLENNQPQWADPDDELLPALKQVSLKNRAVVSILRQTPNQPLYEDLYEDALISHTLHNYNQSKDLTWPLLFPMTKSAVRAMDAVQEFCLEKTQQNISGFVVSGASKRGWTTWLTGALDHRVKAIIPMVIDVLNMPVQMDYQVETWGDYSEEIQDYVNLGIAQDLSTPEGKELTVMIDPYSYREALSMPKMIILGTNDQYWPVDAVKHYLKNLPGENYIHYVPNAGHDLNGGEQAIQSLSAFFGRTLQNKPYPKCAWSVSQLENKVEISVDTEDDGSLITAKIWTAASSDRDFRDEEWINTDLECEGAPDIKASISLPLQGFRAFYIDLVYPAPGGDSYSKSTRVFVMDTSQVL